MKSGINSSSLELWSSIIESQDSRLQDAQEYADESSNSCKQTTAGKTVSEIIKKEKARREPLYT
jgi:hypothetical protein